MQVVEAEWICSWGLPGKTGGILSESGHPKIVVRGQSQKKYRLLVSVHLNSVL